MSGLRFGRSDGQTGAARVNLLPPEIDRAKRASRMRGGIVALAILAVVGVVVATALTLVVAASVQSQLLAAQEETIQILQEQSEFIEVRTVSQEIETLKSAQITGTLTEIDMPELIRAIDATLPAGVLVSTYAIDSGSPIEEFPLPANPLEQPRIATLILTATIPNLDAIQQWVVSLKALTGFADVFVSSVALNQEINTYEAIVTLNLNSELYRDRFAPVDEADTVAEEQGGETG